MLSAVLIVEPLFCQKVCVSISVIQVNVTSAVQPWTLKSNLGGKGLVDKLINGIMSILTLILISAAILGLGATPDDGFELIDRNAYLWAVGLGVFTGFVVFKIRKAKRYSAGDKVKLKVLNAAYPVIVWPFFFGILGDTPKLFGFMIFELLGVFIYVFVFLSLSSLGLIPIEYKTENRM